MNERVTVNLPVLCTVEHENKEQKTNGKIIDLSISGIKIDVPLPSSELKSGIMDFVLELPYPFCKIKGAGEIQWKRWNDKSQSTTCGLKLSPMHLEQLHTGPLPHPIFCTTRQDPHLFYLWGWTVLSYS